MLLSFANLTSSEVKGVETFHARRHLLNTCDLSQEEIKSIIKVAASCKQLYLKDLSPIPVLTNKTIANLFYENSTRTRASFELASKKLGATIISLDPKSSSVAKGETIEDTTQCLISMGVNAIIQRHSAAGSADQIAAKLGNKVHVINAGDGANAHPTQALLDALTMSEIKKDLENSKVLIVGDIAHSRVARSNIWLLNTLGADVHVCGPPTLVPQELSKLNVTVHNHLEPALVEADFVMALRLQLERQTQGLIAGLGEYKKLYRLDHHKLTLAKPNVKVMHPGPVNRDIEITSDLVDDLKYSLISQQVSNGIAIRMAVLYLLLSNPENWHGDSIK